MSSSTMKRLAAVANRLCTKFGTEDVTVTRYAGAIGASAVSATFTVTAPVLPAKGPGNTLDEGSLTRKHYRHILIPAQNAAFEPEFGDVITFAGETWLVQCCDPVGPDASTPITYGVDVVDR